MIAFLGRLLGPLAGKLLAWGGVVAFVVALLLSARKSGRDAAVADGMRKQLENVGTRNDVERANRTAPGSAAERLRNKWARD